MKGTKVKVIGLIVFCLITISVVVLSKTDQVNANLLVAGDQFKEGDNVVLTLKFEKYNNIVKGLNAFKAKLDYSSDVFEEVVESDFMTKNDWEGFKYNKATKEFVAYKKAGSKSEESIVEVILTVKDGVEPCKTNVGMTQIITSEGKEDLELNDAVIPIDIIKEQTERPEEPDKITSSTYDIEDGYISKVLPKTTVQKFKELVETKSEVVFTDIDGNVLEDNSIIKTGTVIKVGEKLSYSIVVRGDIIEDGESNIDDLSAIKLHLIEYKILTGIRLRAADMSYDKEVTIDDIARMKLYIINLSDES